MIKRLCICRGTCYRTKSCFYSSLQISIRFIPRL